MNLERRPLTAPEFEQQWLLLETLTAFSETDRSSILSGIDYQVIHVIEDANSGALIWEREIHRELGHHHYFYFLGNGTAAFSPQGIGHSKIQLDHHEGLSAEAISAAESMLAGAIYKFGPYLDNLFVGIEIAIVPKINGYVFKKRGA